MSATLQGRTFGRLTVTHQHTPALGETPLKNRSARWECSCKCGNTTFVRAASLLNGHTTSCGCARRRPMPELVKTPVPTAGTIPAARMKELQAIANQPVPSDPIELSNWVYAVQAVADAGGKLPIPSHA